MRLSTSSSSLFYSSYLYYVFTFNFGFTLLIICNFRGAKPRGLAPSIKESSKRWVSKYGKECRITRSKRSIALLGFVNESRDGSAGDGARGFVEELGALGFKSKPDPSLTSTPSIVGHGFGFVKYAKKACVLWRSKMIHHSLRICGLENKFCVIFDFIYGFSLFIIFYFMFLLLLGLNSRL